MSTVEFMSPQWIAALGAAAAARTAPDPDPLADLELTIHHLVVEDERPGAAPTVTGQWHLRVDHGAVSVHDGEPEGPADIRLLASAATSRAIARGERAALDAFIAGDLRIGGDVIRLLGAREALESLGDLFASVQSALTPASDAEPRSTRHGATGRGATGRGDA